MWIIFLIIYCCTDERSKALNEANEKCVELQELLNSKDAEVSRILILKIHVNKWSASTLIYTNLLLSKCRDS